MNEWINPAYLEEQFVKEASGQYAGAAPFSHIQLADFLQEEKFAELEEALSQQKFTHKESDLFSLAQTDNLENASNPIIKEFIAFMNSKQTREWFTQITGVETAPGKIDCFGAIYQDTDYLLCHDDQLEDRKIAWILYLTDLSEEQGGALALYTDENGAPKTKTISYQPQANALAFFTVSPQSWHEVEEVTAETYRVSIGGWLKC